VAVHFSCPYLPSHLRRMNWLKRHVLLRLKDRFDSEGNIFLHNNRLDECEGALYEWSRFLYIAQV